MNKPNAILSAWLTGLFLSWTAVAADAPSSAVQAASLREAYYGDLHIHTAYSFDAYVLMGTKTEPETAYRFAKGEQVEYFGETVRRRAPLDFIAVTDHSENLGIFNQLENPDSVVSKNWLGKEFKAAIDSKDFMRLFALLDRYNLNGEPLPTEIKLTSASAWEREIEFANRFYEPGKFTTFIAYEWTSMIDGANLHRNVIFKGAAAPGPFSAIDSKDPEDLWRYLEVGRKNGYEAMAIPHNSNSSGGLMFDWTRFNGRPIDRTYAAMRQYNEPLVEISQNKGNSETHPSLSSNDEFANFEIFDRLLLPGLAPSKPEGSYVRDGLGRGLVLQRIVGVNPYKFGVEASSDLHSGLSVSAQADYAGDIDTANLGGGKPSKEQAVVALNADGDVLPGLITTSGNLTGVWAESNTRESIYDALRRKEVFGTSGTKLKFRFFGGWRFAADLLDDKNWVRKAYESGAAMGSDLPAKSGAGKAPMFAVWAVKDPDAANLDRVQIVKVWEKDGQQQEKVFDVSWSGSRTLDKRTGKLPPVGNSVARKTGEYKNTIGAVELKTVWTDPEFDPDRLAAYYLRVLEIPTPRWSTLLALKYGLPIPTEVAATVQQRGWSSAIWYTPEGL